MLVKVMKIHDDFRNFGRDASQESRFDTVLINTEDMQLLYNIYWKGKTTEAEYMC